MIIEVEELCEVSYTNEVDVDVESEDTLTGVRTVVYNALLEKFS